MGEIGVTESVELIQRDGEVILPTDDFHRRPDSSSKRPGFTNVLCSAKDVVDDTLYESMKGSECRGSHCGWQAAPQV
jgi:hypothetical protein